MRYHHNESSQITQKADIRIKGDVVVKTYIHSYQNQAKLDYKNLSMIQRYFSPIQHNGVTYRALSVVGHPQTNAIVMEHFPGESLKDFFEKTKDPSIFYNMGYWLGMLHRSRYCTETHTVIAFWDYNRGNVLYDGTQMQTTAIDPECQGNLFSDPHESFASGLRSVVRGAAAVAPSKILACASAYVIGYRESAPASIFSHLRLRSVAAGVFQRTAKMHRIKPNLRHHMHKMPATLEALAVLIIAFFVLPKEVRRT